MDYELGNYQTKNLKIRLILDKAHSLIKIIRILSSDKLLCSGKKFKIIFMGIRKPSKFEKCRPFIRYNR